MQSTTSRLTPDTAPGWTAVAFGLGVVAVVVAAYVVSNAVTGGGEEAGPLWLRILVPAAVVAVAAPAVLTGLRARRTDGSLLGSVLLVISALVGAWALFTGVLGFFF